MPPKAAAPGGHEARPATARPRPGRSDLLTGLFDRADHVERLLGHVVAFAVHDLAKALDRVGDLHVTAFETRELLGDEEGLGEEALDLARARYDELVFLRELVDAQDRDD